MNEVGKAKERVIEAVRVYLKHFTVGPMIFHNAEETFEIANARAALAQAHVDLLNLTKPRWEAWKYSGLAWCAGVKGAPQDGFRDGRYSGGVFDGPDASLNQREAEDYARRRNGEAR